jgi:hypothetical protein
MDVTTQWLFLIALAVLATSIIIVGTRSRM